MKKLYGIKMEKNESVGDYFNRQIKKSERLELIWIRNKAEELGRYPDSQLGIMLDLIKKEKKRREKIDLYKQGTRAV